MVRTALLPLAVVGLSFLIPALAEEAHADAIVADILSEVAKIKASDPMAEPIAFWDFDGTIVKGDISVGLVENGREAYPGLVRMAIEAGFSPIYKGADGASKFLSDDYKRMREFGRFLAWPAVGQAFYGAPELELGAFCRSHADKTLQSWVFVSSKKMIDALAKAGIESLIVSGSPDVFVKSAAHIAGIPPERSVGIRQKIVGGRLSTELVYPLPMHEGKIEVIREILQMRPHAIAVAAFGNSYWTDGPFLRYVATQPLPGGAKGTAVMINGGMDDAGFRGIFRCVTQAETCGAGYCK